MEKNLSREERVARSRSTIFQLTIMQILLLVACVAGLSIFIPAKSLIFPALVGVANIFVLMSWIRSAIKHYDYDSDTDSVSLSIYPKPLVLVWVLQVPIISYWILNNILLAGQLSWLLVIVQIYWATLLLAALYLIYTPEKREILFRQLDTYSGFAPYVFSFTFVSIAIFFFASLTFFFLKNNTLSWFTQGNQDIKINQLSYFYLWHFIDAIPVLKLTGTLRWTEPLTYETEAIGLILLFFKILIITPIITTFVEYFRYRRKLEETAIKRTIRRTVHRTYRPRRRTSHQT